MARVLLELGTYRRLLWYQVLQSLKTRYRGAALGFVWTLLNPILLTLVLWVVFSRFGRVSEKNYALFILAGVMVYNWFSQSLSEGQSSIVQARGLIQQVYLPKIIFPTRAVLANAVNFLFFVGAYLVVAPFTEVGLSWTAILVIPALGMVFALSLGVALLMCTLNTFFRDFTHLTSIILRMLFYLTPIIYPIDMLGPKVELALRFNPMTYPVVVLRDALYYHRVSTWEDWATGYAFALVILLFGLMVFSRAEHKFVYYA